MAKKPNGTNGTDNEPAQQPAAQPAASPAVLPDAPPAVDLATVREDLDASLAGIRSQMLEMVAEMRLSVDESLAEMRRRLRGWELEMREDLKLMGNERVRFFQRVEDILEDVLMHAAPALAGPEPHADATPEEPLGDDELQEPEDWMQALVEAEKAVVATAPKDPAVEPMEETVERAIMLEVAAIEGLDDSVPGGVEGLDGDDPVVAAEAVIRSCMESVMSAGGSHVEKVFRQMHGIGTPLPDNS